MSRVISPKPQSCGSYGSFCKYSLEHFPFEEFPNRKVDASWLLIGFPYSLPVYTNRDCRCEVGPTKIHTEPNVVKQLGETTMNDLYSPEDVLWFPILPIYYTFTVFSDDIFFSLHWFHYTAKTNKNQSVLGQCESTPARFSIEHGNVGCSFVHL